MAGLFESPVKTVSDLPDLKYYPIFDKRSWQTPIESETPPKRARISSTPRRKILNSSRISFASSSRFSTSSTANSSFSASPKSVSNISSFLTKTPKNLSESFKFVSGTSMCSTPEASDDIESSSPINNDISSPLKSSPNSSFGKCSSNKRTNTSRKSHYDHRRQYTLDFGQQSSESTHQCRVCKMFYVPNEVDDEKQHRKFHDIQVKGICYAAPWKNEVTLREFSDGKVILVQASLNPAKLKQLFNHVTEELGLCIDINSLREHSLLLLFVTYHNSKRIVGLLTGERIKQAYRLLNDEPLRCSTETVQAEFGISIIWVHQAYRRQKICWRLFDVFCDNVDVQDRKRIAFSQPSVPVINFARKFLETQNLLVYEMEYFKALE